MFLKVNILLKNIWQISTLVFSHISVGNNDLLHPALAFQSSIAVLLATFWTFYCLGFIPDRTHPEAGLENATNFHLKKPQTNRFFGGC